MNKNVINISLLLSTSVLTPEVLSLNSPYELYSHNSTQCPRENMQIDEIITEVSLVQEKSKVWVGISPSIMDGQNLVKTFPSDRDILESVVRKIQASKPLPLEFSKIIDDNFWDLI